MIIDFVIKEGIYPLKIYESFLKENGIYNHSTFSDKSLSYCWNKRALDKRIQESRTILKEMNLLHDIELCKEQVILIVKRLEEVNISDLNMYIDNIREVIQKFNRELGILWQ
jgi:hypothetical protein